MLTVPVSPGLSRRSAHRPAISALLLRIQVAFWLQTFSCRDTSLALGGWIIPHLLPAPGTRLRVGATGYYVAQSAARRRLVLISSLPTHPNSNRRLRRDMFGSIPRLLLFTACGSVSAFASSLLTALRFNPRHFCRCNPSKQPLYSGLSQCVRRNVCALRVWRLAPALRFGLAFPR